MKIKISSSFSGVISRGSYENSRPGFSVDVEFETEEKDKELILNSIDNHQKTLQRICYENFKACEEQAIVERIQKERADIKFYDCIKCGGKHVSVSSITGWDSDFFMPPQELQQYASQGNLDHLRASYFIKTNEWLPVEKIEGSWSDLVIVKRGNLGLEVDKWDFPAFLKKYPLENMEVGEPIVNCQLGFGGTPDIAKCYYEGKKTLADFKRTPDKAKHFKQTAGYVLLKEALGEEPYEQMMLIPSGGKTEQGFSKPIITTEIQQYKAMFLKDKENFKKRFGA